MSNLSRINISRILNYLDSLEVTYYFSGDKNNIVTCYSSLFEYKANSLTFVSSLNDFKDYAYDFKNTNVQLAIISNQEQHYECFQNVLKVEKPKYIFFKILSGLFEDELENEYLSTVSNKYKENSFVSDDAVIHEKAKIGTGCVIEKDVEIGENTVIHHNVVIKSGTKIGKDCNVLSGTVIGETGFNPLKRDDGSRELIKHYGGITIEDDVHIGDNCSISKGTLNDTLLKREVKLNKHVVIAHNVVINKDTVFTSPTFVGGSVVIGKNCHIAATTIRNQCVIGDNAVLGLGSVVVKNVNSDVTVVGNPAKPMKK